MLSAACLRHGSRVCGEPSLLHYPLMKVLKTPRAPRCETVVCVLLMTAEQVAVYLGLLLEAGTQGLASCLVLFFFFLKLLKTKQLHLF